MWKVLLSLLSKNTIIDRMVCLSLRGCGIQGNKRLFKFEFNWETFVLVLIVQSYILLNVVLCSARWVGVPMHSPSRSFAAVKLSKDQAPKKKKRLDEVCLERYEQYSQTYVQSWFFQVANVFQWRDKKLSRALQQLISRETNPL